MPTQSHDDFLHPRWCERDNGHTHGLKRARVQRLVTPTRVGGAECDDLVAGELALAHGRGGGGGGSGEGEEDGGELGERERKGDPPS